jgi:hypothetical protein
VLRFVDHTGVQISQMKYKTHVIHGTLNPVWNCEVVFGEDSGFLHATYLNIEV